jgi:hypothetical protein
MARYDAMGLLWLLEGRSVVALTENSATIKIAHDRTLTYWRHHKPAFGPLGDSLDDFLK